MARSHVCSVFILDQFSFQSCDRTRQTTTVARKHSHNMAGRCYPSLRLAPELRNWVYAYIVSEGGITIYNGTPSIPSLAQTCSQVRKELLPMYQAAENDINTPVHAIVEDLEIRELHRWLKAHAYTYPATPQDQYSMPCRKVYVNLRIRRANSSYDLPYPSETDCLVMCVADQRTRRRMLLVRNSQSWLLACEDEIFQGQQTKTEDVQPQYSNWEHSINQEEVLFT